MPGSQCCNREQHTQHNAPTVVMSTPTKPCTTLPSLTTGNRQNIYVGFPRLTTPLDSINMSLHTIHHHHTNHVPRGRGLAGGPCPLQVSFLGGSHQRQPALSHHLHLSILLPCIARCWLAGVSLWCAASSSASEFSVGMDKCCNFFCLFFLMHLMLTVLWLSSSKSVSDEMLRVHVCCECFVGSGDKGSFTPFNDCLEASSHTDGILNVLRKSQCLILGVKIFCIAATYQTFQVLKYEV